MLTAAIGPCTLAHSQGAPAATAIVLSAADGKTYYRAPLPAAGATGSTPAAAPLAAAPWLAQKLPDALARTAPDGSGVLSRRDRRAINGGIVMQLVWTAPGATAPTETPLTLDTQALAQNSGDETWAIRSVSGLQWPLWPAGYAQRVLLRLTYEAKPSKPVAPPSASGAVPAPDAKTERVTRDVVGWYSIAQQRFATLWSGDGLVGVEPSRNGAYIQLLVQKGGGEPVASVLNADGQAQPIKVLTALRAVGYLYRGWIDGSRLLLKKAGQNQLIVYDAATDSVGAPRGLTAFSGSVAPDGATALLWNSEEAENGDLPTPTDTASGAPIAWDETTWGAAPVTVAAWSEDGHSVLLLAGQNDAGKYTRVLLVGTKPYSVQDVKLPANATIAAARFVYEAAAVNKP